MRLLLLASVLEAHFLALRSLGDLRRNTVEAIVLLLIASLFYIISCWLLLREKSAGPAAGWRWILAAALLFRITVWPLAPALSDDPFRYRWEGKLQAAGGNPYQARPMDEAWAHLRDSTFPRVGSKDFKAVYGPLTELAERAAYEGISRFVADPWRQAFWHKAPYALCDLGVMAALVALLRARGKDPRLVLVYAWSPLAVVEFWATGHNDSLAILFVVVALWAAARERWPGAFAALSLAAAAKIWPVLLFPAFIGWNGRRPLRWYQAWVALPILAILAAPYWSDVGENARFLTGFLAGWRNNDSLYGGLLWLSSGDVYTAKKAAFAILAAAACVVTARRWPLEQAALAVLAAALMASSNCHPWYLTWLLPLLAFHPVPALLLWTAVVPLAYESVIAWSVLGEWHGLSSLRWYGYAPMYGLLAWHAASRVLTWRRSALS